MEKSTCISQFNPFTQLSFPEKRKRIRLIDPSLSLLTIKKHSYIYILICFQAAEFLDIPDLFNVLNATKQDIDNPILNKTISSLEDLCLVDGVFSDILFKLEDGTCAAHKAILTARSDMM